MKENNTINIETIKSILHNNRDEIKKKYKAEIRGIFGSYSRDEATGKSDVDILVHFEKGATLFGWAGLTKYLENKLGASVDVVPEKNVKKEMKPQITKDLIKI
jgi:uncharacterized protein